LLAPASSAGPIDETSAVFCRSGRRRPRLVCLPRNRGPEDQFAEARVDPALKLKGCSPRIIAVEGDLGLTKAQSGRLRTLWFSVVPRPPVSTWAPVGATITGGVATGVVPDSGAGFARDSLCPDQAIIGPDANPTAQTLTGSRDTPGARNPLPA